MGRAFGRVGVLACERKGELQMDDKLLGEAIGLLVSTHAALNRLADELAFLNSRLDSHGLTLRAPDASEQGGVLPDDEKARIKKYIDENNW
jgi:hypothetical protein